MYFLKLEDKLIQESTYSISYPLVQDTPTTVFRKTPMAIVKYAIKNPSFNNLTLK